MLPIIFSVDGGSRRPSALVDDGARDLFAHVADLKALIEAGPAGSSSSRSAVRRSSSMDTT